MVSFLRRAPFVRTAVRLSVLMRRCVSGGVCFQRCGVPVTKRRFPVPGWADADQTECSDAPGKAEIDPAQLVVQREDTQRLDNRLREILTSLEYEVLMLYFGAYTYEEIAQRLGIRTKAVDNALQRIRRKLASQPLLD